MHSALPVLGNHALQMASPCDVPWEAMRGNDRQRRCDQCDKNVYNIARLAPEELVTLIEKTEGQFCGRLFQRADGTLQTEDCPVGLARTLRRAKRKSLLGAAALVTALASAASMVLGGDPVQERPIVKETIKKIEAITPKPEPIPVAGGLRAYPLPAPKPVDPPKTIR